MSDIEDRLHAQGVVLDRETLLNQLASIPSVVDAIALNLCWHKAFGWTDEQIRGCDQWTEHLILAEKTLRNDHEPRSALDYEGFCRLLEMYRSGHPEQRDGQAAYNYLQYVRPDLAGQIAGTDIDPFYDNGKLGEFHRKLRTEMGS